MSYEWASVPCSTQHFPLVIHTSLFINNSPYFWAVAVRGYCSARVIGSWWFLISVSVSPCQSPLDEPVVLTDEVIFPLTVSLDKLPVSTLKVKVRRNICLSVSFWMYDFRAFSHLGQLERFFLTQGHSPSEFGTLLANSGVIQKTGFRSTTKRWSGVCF